MRPKLLNNMLTIFAAMVLILLLAACGGTSEEPPVESTLPAGETNDAVTPVPMDMEDVTDETNNDEEPREMPEPGIPNPQSFMTEQVTIALADRLGIDTGAITVASVQAMEWADAALGCADPGQSYAQVITPGFEITLSAGGETYTYHTDMEGNFVLCAADGRSDSSQS